jgi:hypothetical protein
MKPFFAAPLSCFLLGLRKHSAREIPIPPWLMPALHRQFGLERAQRNPETRPLPKPASTMSSLYWLSLGVRL